MTLNYNHRIRFRSCQRKTMNSSKCMVFTIHYSFTVWNQMLYIHSILKLNAYHAKINNLEQSSAKSSFVSIAKIQFLTYVGAVFQQSSITPRQANWTHLLQDFIMDLTWTQKIKIYHVLLFCTIGELLGAVVFLGILVHQLQRAIYIFLAVLVMLDILIELFSLITKTNYGFKIASFTRILRIFGTIIVFFVFFKSHK